MVVKGWRARLLPVLFCFAYSAAHQCSVKYTTSSDTSLLFGGVSSSCVSGCRPRNLSEYWAGVCAYDATSNVWGVCSPEQSRHSLEYARTLSNILQLSPCHLVKYLRGRTLWLLGDSHSKTLYRALQCFLFDFWDQHECQVSADPDDVAALLKQPAADGISNCFHLTGPGGGRVCMVQVVLATSLVNNTQVAAGGVLPLLRSRLAAPADIFYINVGSWHRKSDEWGQQYQPALDTLGAYYKATKSEWPHLLFRETPALHPINTSSNTCTPLTGYEYKPHTGRVVLSASARRDVKMQWVNAATLNKMARDTLLKYNIPVTPAFNITAPLHDNHVGTRLSAVPDCLHYCSPGVPEIWIFYLYNALKNGKTGIKALPVSTAATGSSSISRDVASLRTQSQQGSAGQAKPSAASKQQKASHRQVPSDGQYVCTPSTIRF